MKEVVLISLAEHLLDCLRRSSVGTRTRFRRPSRVLLAAKRKCRARGLLAIERADFSASQTQERRELNSNSERTLLSERSHSNLKGTFAKSRSSLSDS